MPKQSSIEWFAKMLAEQGLLVTRDYENLITYREAKQMHKEEIITTYVQGWTERFSPTGTAKNYYTKTFGGNNE